jgi:hypothetical protein
VRHTKTKNVVLNFSAHQSLSIWGLSGGYFLIARENGSEICCSLVIVELVYIYLGYINVIDTVVMIFYRLPYDYTVAVYFSLISGLKVKGLGGLSPHL